MISDSLKEEEVDSGSWYEFEIILGEVVLWSS
jgi:hypothetical protein